VQEAVEGEVSYSCQLGVGEIGVRVERSEDVGVGDDLGEERRGVVTLLKELEPCERGSGRAADRGLEGEPPEWVDGEVVEELYKSVRAGSECGAECERWDELAGETELVVVGNQPARLLAEPHTSHVEAELGRVDRLAATCRVDELFLQDEEVVDLLVVVGERSVGSRASVPEGARGEGEKSSRVRGEGCNQSFGLFPRLAQALDSLDDRLVEPYCCLRWVDEDLEHRWPVGRPSCRRGLLGGEIVLQRLARDVEDFDEQALCQRDELVQRGEAGQKPAAVLDLIANLSMTLELVDPALRDVGGSSEVDECVEEVERGRVGDAGHLARCLEVDGSLDHLEGREVGANQMLFAADCVLLQR
jgi:hypothetical protein